MIQLIDNQLKYVRNTHKQLFFYVFLFPFGAEVEFY